MVHGVMIATHAAAAAAEKARTAVLDAFRVNGATAPERARPLSELGLGDGNSALGEWVQRGVVRAVDSRGRPAVLGDSMGRIGGYYLDEAAYIAQRDHAAGSRSRRAVALVALAMLLVILGTMLLLVAQRTQ